MLTRTVVCGVLLASLAAAHAAVPMADVEQVWLDPAGRGSLLLGNGQTLEAARFRAGVAVLYTQANLRARDSLLVLLKDRVGAQVFGAVGVTDWLELSANVPVLILQSGDPALGLAQGGLGNPFIGATIGILDRDKPLALAFGLAVGVPIGTAAAQGNGGVEVMPRLVGGKVYDDFEVGLEVAGLVRPMVDYAPLTHGSSDRVGSELSLAAMLATVNTSGPRGEVTVRAHVPLTGGAAGVEAQIGVRWPVGGAELFASMGPGFGGAPATPAVRVYAGVAFANTALTQPPCVEGLPYALERCPHLDRDRDGVPNALDAAPIEPEDRDEFRDADGEPDPDNDSDGVLDPADRCPIQPGPAANEGCPDADSDGDGVVDRLDRCAAQAEDRDDFEDGDGCPDPDNDGDAVADEKDACPRQPGIPEEKGCPAKDSDGDGVFDFVDNCPTEKGAADNQGCPAAQKQLVVITREKLKILDRVYFDTGRATIQRRSDPLLDQLANVLAAHPEIALVQVEGHTDNVGTPEANRTLSQARAEAVRAALVKRGVSEARLRAVGLGQDRPAAPNDTPQGRDANRRVEFNLVQP